MTDFDAYRKERMADIETQRRLDREYGPEVYPSRPEPQEASVGWDDDEPEWDFGDDPD